MQYAKGQVRKNWQVKSSYFKVLNMFFLALLMADLSYADNSSSNKTKQESAKENAPLDAKSQNMPLAAPLKAPLNENRLWLPLKYKKHHLSLLRAANQALAQPRCYEIKRGSLDLRQSTESRPVYRFLCKQTSGKTYTEMIDGVTFNSLIPAPTSEIACYELLMAKTHMMKEIKWLNNHALKAVKGSPERYEWRFDAASLEGEPLKYTAVCKLNAHNLPEINITPRRN